MREKRSNLSKTAAIIAEYNPFHNGHAYHIAETRRITGAENVVAVMSGDFVQRGGCACLDKFVRCEAALKGGVDLVIELPTAFAVSSAPNFARGAAGLINALGIADFLSFGAETPDTDKLRAMAEMGCEENNSFGECLKAVMKTGASYARAAGAAGAARQPNDILASEYLRALKRLGSAVKPVAVPREGAAHDGEATEGRYCSASRLRQAAKERDKAFAERFAPPETVAALSDCADFGLFSPVLHHNALTRGFKGIQGMVEGLENRFQSACRENAAISEVCAAVKCKRYTMAAIRRAATCAVLGVTSGDAAAFAAVGARYVRVLGYRKGKSFLLNDIAANSPLPLIVTAKQGEGALASDAAGRKMWSLDVFAAELYRAVSGRPHSEYETACRVV